MFHCGAEPARTEQAKSLAWVKSQCRFQGCGKNMRRKQHFFAETVARRPTFCNFIEVKFFNLALNRAQARPEVFKEKAGAVSSQTSEWRPLQVSVACGDGIAIDATHGSDFLNHLRFAICHLKPFSRHPMKKKGKKGK